MALNVRIEGYGFPGRVVEHVAEPEHLRRRAHAHS